MLWSYKIAKHTSLIILIFCVATNTTATTTSIRAHVAAAVAEVATIALIIPTNTYVVNIYIDHVHVLPRHSSNGLVLRFKGSLGKNVTFGV